MKKLSLYGILLVCSVCCSVRAAAQQQVKLQFIDATTNEPVSKVVLITQEGTETATSDKNGFVTIAPAEGKYLIAIHKGYKPDTFRNNASPIIRLKPLSVELDDIYVTNKKLHRVLHSGMEYVVDYDFVDDNILVASYSGNNGRNAKLFLLNDMGDTLALQKFPDEPVALFKSCTGRYYCVCTDKLYPLNIEEGKINLREPYDIKVLVMLKECEQNIDSTFYYHSVDREAFSSVYSLRNVNDIAPKPFYKIEQYADALGNAEEQQMVARMLSLGNFRGAAKLNGIRILRNDISYRSFGLPIFRTSDSLVIFDFNKKKINYFSPNGATIARTGISFNTGKTFRINIVQDIATGKFYLHNTATQMLEEINVSSGETQGPGIAIKKPFAEKIKVHKGNVYYLWQDLQNNSTRQLFVQAN